MAGPELKADASVTPAALHANPASCLRVPEHMRLLLSVSEQDW